jgi:uncharacterized protein YkwD
MRRSAHGRLYAGVVLAAALGLVAESPAAAAGCPGASASAASASTAKLRSALLCVVNNKRAANGLRALKVDRRIQRAAGRHARDMERRHYFAHQRPGGPDLTTRLHRAGWYGHAWGEAIAYGCGPLGSPRATVRAWMNSPPHRAIILSGTYKHGGVGVTDTAPCGPGGIWVLDVGKK